MSTEKTTYIFNYVDKGANAQNATIGRFKKMDKTVDELEGNYTESTKKMTQSTGKLKDGVNQLGSEFPLLGRAISFATSPLGAFTIAAGIGIGIMHKAIDASKVFNKEFLQLEQLNLDKSKEEIAGLKDSVLDLAFDKALNPQATSQAFFDIQSATGKYGAEVEKIVGRTGEFARAVQADFNTMVDGVGKATNAFQLQGSEIDNFLQSSAKTVQVGVTTFDQLAQVQTEFAGAAAAAGQGYDEANKIFAVFTKTSKNVDIAATKTKGFFEDLSKLDKIDIDVFNDQGEFRKMDKIVKDINDKFKKLDSQKIDGLIKEVGGNEGLRGMLKAVAANGETVLQTFEDFDNTDFDINEAIDNANKDLDIMGEKLDNKLQVAFIKLGDVAKPLMITIKSLLIDLIDLAEGFIENLNYAANIEGYLADKHRDSNRDSDFVVKHQIQSFLGDDFDSLSERDQQRKLDAVKLGLARRIDYQESNLNKSKFIEEGVEGTSALERTGTGGLFKFAADAAVNNQENVKVLKGVLDQLSLVNDPTELNDLLKSQSQIDFENEQLFGDEASGGGSGGSNSLSGVEVAGARVRNVTVNIQNLINELLINSETQEMSIEELTQAVTEALIRSVRDAELTLSTE